MWCKTWALQYLIVTRISSTGGVTKVWLSLHHLSPSASLFYSSFWVFPTHISTQQINGSSGKRPHNCIFYVKLHIPMFTHLSLDFIPLLSQRGFPCWAHTWLYQLPCVDTAGGFGVFWVLVGFWGVFLWLVGFLSLLTSQHKPITPPPPNYIIWQLPSQTAPVLFPKCTPGTQLSPAPDLLQSLLLKYGKSRTIVHQCIKRYTYFLFQN